MVLAAFGGLVVGVLALYLVSRRWIAGAHTSGRASRDAENRRGEQKKASHLFLPLGVEIPVDHTFAG